MRLALLSPLPPAGTGIADYTAEVAALLAPRHEIDLFHAQERVETRRLPASCGVYPVNDLAGHDATVPYDVVVHQLGNASDHAFIYEHLARFPGLLVLHDLVLHHSRARMFLDAPAVRAYAADPANARLRDAARGPLAAYASEVAYAYPAEARRLHRVQLGTIGDLLPYAYPLFRIPVESSRLTAVHNGFMAEAIAEEMPEAPVATLAMPVEPVSVPREDVAQLRQRYGFSPEDLVVGSFGLLTREKRIATTARAVARAAAAVPRIKLLLVGPVADRPALDALLARLSMSERTVVTGRVPFEELPAHMGAVDVAVHLRYPTARETSAALLRLLAQGRPTIMADLENLSEVPQEAAVRVDIGDEEGEVTRAILRLSESPETRRRLGTAAEAFVRREHSPARCLESYELALRRAAALPPPRRSWPASLGAARRRFPR